MLNHWSNSHSRDSKGLLFHIEPNCDGVDELDDPLSGVKIDADTGGCSNDARQG